MKNIKIRIALIVATLSGILNLVSCTENGSIPKEHVAKAGKSLTREDIARIEAKLVMPPDAQSIASYVRYYAIEHRGSEDFVVGTFVLEPGAGRVEIRPLDEHPRILDGGCTVLSLQYSLQREMQMSMRCNGFG